MVFSTCAAYGLSRWSAARRVAWWRDRGEYSDVPPKVDNSHHRVDFLQGQRSDVARVNGNQKCLSHRLRQRFANGRPLRRKHVMRLVQDDHAVLLQQGVGHRLAQQHAVRRKPARSRGRRKGRQAWFATTGGRDGMLYAAHAWPCSQQQSIGRRAVERAQASRAAASCIASLT